MVNWWSAGRRWSQQRQCGQCTWRCTGQRRRAVTSEAQPYHMHKLMVWCRPMPLTAAGGANAVNAQDEGAGGGGAGLSEAGQPAVKKAKGAADKGKKRALKRL